MRKSKICKIIDKIMSSRKNFNNKNNLNTHSILNICKD